MKVGQRESILKKWDLTEDELTEIISENPSMRGLMLGYVAEYKLRKMYFGDQRFSNVIKYNNHDRNKKGDLMVVYKDKEFTIECKSLQTNTIQKSDKGFFAKYQCDASDQRKVTFSDGSQIETTCLLVGEFDIIAVNLFALEEKWRFAFALNYDLPRTKYKKYTEIQRNELLATLMPITWPLEKPYVDDPFILLNFLIDDSSLK
jgi:hypothetical protein